LAIIARERCELSKLTLFRSERLYSVTQESHAPVNQNQTEYGRRDLVHRGARVLSSDGASFLIYQAGA